MFTVKRSGFATYHWVTLDRRLNLSGPQLLHVQNMPVESQSFLGWLGKGVSERGYTRKYFVNQETYRTVYGGTNRENATISNFKRSDGDGYGYFSSCPHRVPVGHLCSAFAGLNGGFRATRIWFQGSRFLSPVFFSPSLPGPDRPRFVCACPVPLCGGVSCPSCSPEGHSSQPPWTLAVFHSSYSSASSHLLLSVWPGP